MFTFSLCITNYADTSLGWTWGHPESVLYSLGFTSSGDSSILLVSKWEPKVPLTCQWLSRPGCQLCRELLFPRFAEMQKCLSLSLSLAVLSLLVDVTLRTAVYLLLPDNELTVRIGTHAFQN